MLTLINRSLTSETILARKLGVPQSVQLPPQSRTLFDDSWTFIELGPYVFIESGSADQTYSYLSVQDAIINLPEDALTNTLVTTAEGFIFSVSDVGDIVTVNGKKLTVYSQPASPDRYFNLLAMYARNIVSVQQILKATQEINEQTANIYNQVLYLKPTQREFMFAVSDETSNLLVGNNKISFRLPIALTLTELRASVNVAPTGGDISILIRDSTKNIATVEIDQNQETSFTSSSFNLINPVIMSDTRLYVDIVSVGTTLPGAGLKISLVGTFMPEL